MLDAYNYGYEIGPSGQFHHEVHGPDGVTYGCYGYTDPYGKLTATFYLSDGWGYRIVRPGDRVELFLQKHEHHHETGKHDHHGILTEWEDLHFPPVCSQFEQQRPGN